MQSDIQLNGFGVNSSLDSKRDHQSAGLERLKMEAVAAEDFELAASLKTQIAAIKSPPEEASTATFLANMLQYFNDNYLMMMMAASAGNIGADIFDGKSIIINALFAWLIAVGITIVLRIGLLWLYAWAKSKEAGGAENAGTVRMVGYMLIGMIWIPRVPWIGVIAEIIKQLQIEVYWESAADYQQAGQGFLIPVSMTIFCLLNCFLGTFLLRRTTDSADPDMSWYTFAVSAYTLSFTSAAGKALHLSSAVIADTFVLDQASAGTSYWRLIVGGALENVILFLLAWWLLNFCTPMMRESQMAKNSEANQVIIEVQEYVIVYGWAFVFVNYMWEICYTELTLEVNETTGFAVFLTATMLGMVFASLLAWSTPGKSFYNMEGVVWKQTLCLMNYWYCDFMIWWAWAQVLVYMDSDVKGSEEIPDTNPTVSVNTESNAAFNAACMIGLLALTGLVNYMNVDSLSSLNDKIPTKNCEEMHTQDENVDASPELNPTRAPEPKNEEPPTAPPPRPRATAERLRSRTSSAGAAPAVG